MTGTSISINRKAELNIYGQSTVPAQQREHGSFAELDLANKLHTTLDIRHLIDSFINEIRKTLPCDGIEYREDSVQLTIVDGVLSEHRCCYDIANEMKSLGSISFTREKAFRQDEIDILENMVAGLAIPLQNSLRYQRAIRTAQRDELTGLRNCSYYYDNVELEIQRAQRYDTPFSMLLIDLDDFNDINTQYSYRAGDAILVELASRLEAMARGSDIVFRTGGDEFLVFLPNTEREEAMHVAERIRTNVNLDACLYDNRSIKLTLSIGVVTFLADDTVFKLIDRGEKALFHAKILGKNRVHTEPVTEPVEAQ